MGQLKKFTKKIDVWSGMMMSKRQDMLLNFGVWVLLRHSQVRHCTNEVLHHFAVPGGVYFKAHSSTMIAQIPTLHCSGSHMPLAGFALSAGVPNKSLPDLLNGSSLWYMHSISRLCGLLN